MSLTSETTPQALAHPDGSPVAEKNNEDPKEFSFWSSFALVAWLVGGGTLLCVLLFEPDSAASDPRIPRWLPIGLMPLQTILCAPLAAVYASLPALLLQAEPQLRRVILSFILFLVAVTGLAQLIATRTSFCFLNIVFSFLGVSLANVCALRWYAGRNPCSPGH